MQTLDDFLKRANPIHVDIAYFCANSFKIPDYIFLALVSVESAWNPNARGNGTSAFGLCQLTTAAAKDVGVDPYASTYDNLRGGAAYLAMQFKRFGNWRDALGAYNQGAGKYNNDAGREYADKILKLAEYGDENG